MVVVGHSSGGSFAHWLAARSKLPRSSPLYAKNPLHVKAIVNVDGPPDMAAFQPMERKFCPVPGLTQLMGGTPAEQPERYGQSFSRLPAADRGPADHCRGGLCSRMYDLVSSYEAAAKAKGDSVTVLKLDGAGHFDMLAPGSQYGKPVNEAILALLK